MNTYSTPQDLADEFQVSGEFVRRKAREGKWPVSKFGNAFRFSPEDREQIRDMVRSPVREPERKPEGIRELVEQLRRTEAK
ncbi:hypothetical protein [Zhihengliuella halotolerans]|uniref:hypothetical protein n=1 Tax=Zhihengliuella halotolerans TaxID=370736 RepID=UPI000C7F848E|nr:hypothetical protein [Zhihengliuella halotolerans]